MSRTGDGHGASRQLFLIHRRTRSPVRWSDRVQMFCPRSLPAKDSVAGSARPPGLADGRNTNIVTAIPALSSISAGPHPPRRFLFRASSRVYLLRSLLIPASESRRVEAQVPGRYLPTPLPLEWVCVFLRKTSRARFFQSRLIPSRLGSLSLSLAILLILSLSLSFSP